MYKIIFTLYNIFMSNTFCILLQKFDTDQHNAVFFLTSGYTSHTTADRYNQVS